MKFTYDPEADALSLRLSNASFADSDEVAPGIIVDYDEEGQVIAVEMLDVTKRSYVEVELPNLSASPLQSGEYSQTARISDLQGVVVRPAGMVIGT